LEWGGAETQARGKWREIKQDPIFTMKRRNFIDLGA
jgi:hypothetical protein